MNNAISQPRKKILFLITKSNWGANENSFSFAPILSVAQGQSLLSEAKQTVGGPAQLLSSLYSFSYCGTAS